MGWLDWTALSGSVLTAVLGRFMLRRLERQRWSPIVEALASLADRKLPDNSSVIVRWRRRTLSDVLRRRWRVSVFGPIALVAGLGSVIRREAQPQEQDGLWVELYLTHREARQLQRTITPFAAQLTQLRGRSERLVANSMLEVVNSIGGSRRGSASPIVDDETADVAAAQAQLLRARLVKDA